MSDRGGMGPLALFLSLVYLSQVSERAFFALSAASDLLPLATDLGSTFPARGTGPDDPDPLDVLLGPGLLILLLVLGAVSPSLRSAILAAGDIVPFPRDFGRTVGVAPSRRRGYNPTQGEDGEE